MKRSEIRLLVRAAEACYQIVDSGIARAPGVEEDEPPYVRLPSDASP